MYPPIKDYALIGNCRTAALVSRHGSIDWLCLPRFDSPSIFAGLLDDKEGGQFTIRPVREFEVERRYVRDTAVLETRFATDTGVLRLLDAMPVVAKTEAHLALQPSHEVLRIVECIGGEVEVEVRYNPRPDYGKIRPRLRDRGSMGLCYGTSRQRLALRSEIPLHMSPDRSAALGRSDLTKGQRRCISLTVTDREPAVVVPLGTEANARLDRTMSWWQAWAGQCQYRGSYRDAVIRSAITLKMLTYAPSGAVVAAPTTSLPEIPGGVRNWDYRYCWLRDASLTLQALFDLGYRQEAEAYMSWLLHTTRGIHLRPRVLYDVYGEHRLKEVELSHLHGYDGARPVRIGNDASQQLQLDNFGEITDAVYEFVSRGGTLHRETSRLLVAIGNNVCRRWRDPDNGIWEVRGPPKHYVHSKALCWVALDRLIRLHDEGLLRVPIEQFRQESGRIRAAIETRGYNRALQTYTAVFDGDDVDASLLQLARYGYVAADSPRMLGTYERIHERLGRNGLLLRYLSGHDGLPPGEGAFGIASFWAAEALARQGRNEEAVAKFEHLLSLANDVGLFAEEIDVGTGEALGNFPQAFTHVGLIDAALMLAEQAGKPGLRHPDKRRQGTRERV
jgi:GH15 family glucan-1,4-alpha-glucosidase